MACEPITDLDYKKTSRTSGRFFIYIYALYRMTIKRLTYIIYLLVAVLFHTSCTDDFGKPSWDTELAIPLMTTSLSIEDVIPDSLLKIYEDGSASLLLTHELYNLTFDTLLRVPDTITNNSFVFPLYFLANPGQVLFNKSSENQLKIGDVELTQIKIKSGTVDVRVTNTVARKVLFTYTLNNALLSGAPFVSKFVIPEAANGVEGVTLQSYDATGYVFDLRGTAKNQFNTMLSNGIAQIDTVADPVLLSPLDSTVIYTKLNNLRIAEARGYFGRSLASIGPETNHFDFFKSILAGSIGLEAAKLSFEITNGVGIDAQIKLKQLYSYNSKNKKKVMLKGSIVNTPINITRAKETGNTADPFIPSVKKVDMSLSNFKDLLENMPDAIGYALDITTNPLGNVSSGNDFLFDKSAIKAAFTIEIPLSGRVNNIQLKDTLKLAVSKKQLENIKSGDLTINVMNGFPFDGKIQLYMLNENNKIIDSVFTDSYLGSAILDINNKVEARKHSKFVITLDKSKLDNMANTKSFLVKAALNTPGTGSNMRIYTFYSIDVDIKCHFSYRVNTKKT